MLPLVPAWAASSQHPAEVTGLVVPLYGQLTQIHPVTGEWAQLIDARRSNPSVPIVAIVNPANGSGAEQNPGYAEAIGELRTAGVVVLGYVSTLQAQRPIFSVQAEIVDYRFWYHVDGIYFDQMPQQPGNESYYSGMTTFAKSLGMSMAMGNPGAATSSSYIGTVDTLIVYENGTVPSLAYLASWDRAGIGKESFAFIANEVPRLNETYIDQAARLVGFMFISSSGSYFTLPSYFSQEAGMLRSLAPGRGGASPLSGTTVFAAVEVGGPLALRSAWMSARSKGTAR